MKRTLSAFVFKITLFSFIFLFNFSSISTFAQNIKPDTSNATSDKYNQVDAYDLLNKITKKSSKILQDTIFVHSKGPFITPLVIPGYAMVNGFLGELTTNISFYTLRNDSAKISTIFT